MKFVKYSKKEGARSFTRSVLSGAAAVAAALMFAASPAQAYGSHGGGGGHGGGGHFSGGGAHFGGGHFGGSHFSGGHFSGGHFGGSQFGGWGHGYGYGGWGHGYGGWGRGYWGAGYWGPGWYGYWPLDVGFGYTYDAALAAPYIGLSAWDIGYNDGLTEADLRAQQNAMVQATSAPLNQQITWGSANGGASGSVTPVRDGRTSDGRLCREFQQHITVEGKPQTAYGTACQQGDGAWQIIGQN